MEASRELLTCDLPEDDYLVPPVNSPLYRNCADAIAEELAAGSKIIAAAFKYKIDRKTIQAWSKHAHFLALIESKKEIVRQRWLERIDLAGEKAHLWSANAWLLERSPAFKGEYAQPRTSQATASLTVNVSLGSQPGNSEGITIDVGPGQACEDEK